jgi:hypothetical protein
VLQDGGLRAPRRGGFAKRKEGIQSAPLDLNDRFDRRFKLRIFAALVITTSHEAALRAIAMNLLLFWSETRLIHSYLPFCCF